MIFIDKPMHATFPAFPAMFAGEIRSNFKIVSKHVLFIVNLAFSS